ncbi:MAG: biotin--[acetyl-CoA-carboxylase] ligase [Deltaproteobacteria bacterium]
MRSREDIGLEIIRILKACEGGYASGQALSLELGVSRTAVWKHIKLLKKTGFLIEAAPSKGYRLASTTLPFNDIEVSSSLSTEFIGGNIYFFRSLDSTNTRAYELGRGGCPEGTAVIADSQTNGKGRVGRRWESLPGVNLYTSIVLRPPVPPQNANNLTFLSAVALAESVSHFIRRRPSVKWPNDVLVDGRKIAGILLEMDSEADRVHFVVAGIGVNLNMKEEMFPEFLRNTATSVMEKAGGAVDRAEFARSLYSSIEKWYKIYLKEGFTPVLDEWRGYFEAAGRPVKVTSFNRTVEGICAGVDMDGALLVRTPSGKVERVVSGDVVTAR